MSEKEIELYKDIIYAEKVFDVNFQNVSKKLYEEIERLQNIIKEVREYIERYDLDYINLSGNDYFAEALENILEILDKENNK